MSGLLHVALSPVDHPSQQEKKYPELFREMEFSVVKPIHHACLCVCFCSCREQTGLQLFFELLSGESKRVEKILHL